MSKHFTKPFNPINWPAVPQDFTKQTGGAHNLQLGIYTKETVQRYVYGTRYITWDGRVYKYMGVTTNGVTSYVACCNTLAAPLGYTAAVAGNVGDRTYVITTTGIAEDEWAGAMLQLYRTSDAIANSTHHFIVGNEKDNSTNVTVYLEFPLPVAPDTSDWVEVFANPYRLVSGSLASNAYSAFVGVSNVTAATGYKVWVQTWGPSIISTGNTTCDDPTGGERQVFFYAQGTIKESDDDTITVSHQQFAGYILNQGTAIAGPQIYLMCST